MLNIKKAIFLLMVIGLVRGLGAGEVLGNPHNNWTNEFLLNGKPFLKRTPDTIDIANGVSFIVKGPFLFDKGEKGCFFLGKGAIVDSFIAKEDIILLDTSTEAFFMKELSKVRPMGDQEREMRFAYEFVGSLPEQVRMGKFIDYLKEVTDQEFYKKYPSFKKIFPDLPAHITKEQFLRNPVPLRPIPYQQYEKMIAVYDNAPPTVVTSVKKISVPSTSPLRFASAKKKYNIGQSFHKNLRKISSTTRPTLGVSHNTLHSIASRSFAPKNTWQSPAYLPAKNFSKTPLTAYARTPVGRPTAQPLLNRTFGTKKTFQPHPPSTMNSFKTHLTAYTRATVSRTAAHPTLRTMLTARKPLSTQPSSKSIIRKPVFLKRGAFTLRKDMRPLSIRRNFTLQKNGNPLPRTTKVFNLNRKGILFAPTKYKQRRWAKTASS